MDVRDLVAAQLDAMTAPGGPLATAGPRATVAHPTDFQRGAPVPARRKLWREVRTRYLTRQTGIEQGGKAALLTAGSPGAGKSTTLDRLGLVRDGWRRLDADIVKTYLLEHDTAAGRFEDLLGLPLSDGHRLLLAELAPLVHNESVAILDLIRADCLARGENVLLEGTLSWEPAAVKLLNQLVADDYREVTILDVEVTRDTAREQALTRWWDGRQQALTTGTGPGGRYVPTAVIDAAYSPTDPAPPGRSRPQVHSNATAIARRLFDSDTGRPLQTLRLTVVDNTGHSPIVETHERRAGSAARVVDFQGALPELGPTATPTAAPLFPRP